MKVRIMKVRVVLTVELDEEEWAETFGLLTPKEVREDVKAYVLDAVQEAPVSSSLNNWEVKS